MAAVKLSVLLASALTTLFAQKAYVGSKTCYGCHAEIYKSYTKTAMGRSMSRASDWKTLPPQAIVAQPGTPIQFSVAQREGTWKQTESQPDVFSAEYPLDYAVGSGQNGLTFLVKRGDFLFQAPLSYYIRTGKWDLSPGYEHAELGFNRQVPEECINCHAGRTALKPNGAGAYANPPFPELAIGCENCHGPGQAHIQAKNKNSIINPAKLPQRLAENICLNCHQAGDARVLQQGKTFADFRPGQWLFDTAVIFKQPATTPEQQQADLLEHFTAMQTSRCYRESNGKLGCLTCHDPHVQPAKAADFNVKCMGCHSVQSCKLPLKARADDNCTACHMPKRDVQQISHSALTNHRIPAREGESIVPAPGMVVDGVTVVNPPGNSMKLSKVVLLRAYRQMQEKSPEYQARYSALLTELEQTNGQDSFVQAAIGDRAYSNQQWEDAATHLKRALPENSPAIFLELAQALQKLDRVDEAIEYLKKGVELDPYDATLQKTLILAFINSKSYAEAKVLMQRYVDAFPEDALMRNLLARVSQ